MDFRIPKIHDILKHFLEQKFKHRPFFLMSMGNKIMIKRIEPKFLVPDCNISTYSNLVKTVKHLVIGELSLENIHNFVPIMVKYG